MKKEYKLNNKVQDKKHLPCLYPANLRDEMEILSISDIGTLVKYQMIFDHIKKGDTVHLWIDDNSPADLTLHALVRFQIEGVKVEVLSTSDNSERLGVLMTKTIKKGKPVTKWVKTIEEINTKYDGRLDLWLSDNTPERLKFSVTDHLHFERWLEFNIEHIEWLFDYSDFKVWGIDGVPVFLQGEEFQGMFSLVYCNDNNRGTSEELWYSDFTPCRKVIL